MLNAGVPSMNQMNDVCPNCGYCPSCGRRNYYPQTIGYQTPPMWCGTSILQQESVLQQYQNAACNNQQGLTATQAVAQGLAQAQCNANNGKAKETK